MLISPEWQQITPQAAFSIRDTAEPFVFRDAMWLSNGYYYGGVLSRDLWRSEDGVDWTCVLDDTPYDGYSEMALFDHKVWAVKGSVWNSTDGVNWTRVAETTPFGVRGYGEVVVFRDRLWQLGNGNDVWSSGDGIGWECACSDAPFGPRYGSAVAAIDGALWLMGGATQETGDPPEKHYPDFVTHNDVWRSTDGSHWARVVDDAPWTARMWFVAEVYAGRLWIIGGFSNREGANLGDVWYTEDGSAWHEYEPKPAFSPRHEATPYVFDGSLWVVAGNSWPLMNDVWKLTLA
jgi:hypothetical protein